MGCCKDCKWWTGYERPRENLEGWGDCERLDNYVMDNTKLFTYWGEGIITAPDFGCVQFEAKE